MHLHKVMSFRCSVLTHCTNKWSLKWVLRSNCIVDWLVCWSVAECLWSKLPQFLTDFIGTVYIRSTSGVYRFSSPVTRVRTHTSDPFRYCTFIDYASPFVVFECDPIQTFDWVFHDFMMILLPMVTLVLKAPQAKVPNKQGYWGVIVCKLLLFNC